MPKNKTHHRDTENTEVAQRKPRLLPALIVTLLPTLLSFYICIAVRQQTPQRAIVFPTTIQWSTQRGVTRFRLQIASDEKFQNVFFDGLVKGERYIVSNLSAGHYYWRVAAADSQPGGYSKPVRFFVSGGVVQTVKLSEPPALAGGLERKSTAARSRRRF
jgi:hypothetical protein